MSDVNINGLPPATQLYGNTRLETQNPVTAVNEKAELQHLSSGPALFRLQNNTGAEIPQNALVAYDGYDDTTGNVGVKLADNTSGDLAIGMAIAAVANGSNGYGIRIGITRMGIDLTGTLVGDAIWLGTAGQAVNDPPATGHLQIVARVMAAEPNGPAWFDSSVDAELLTLQPDWQAGAQFHPDVTTVFEKSIWRCLQEHVAADFVSDLGAGRWELLSSGVYASATPPTAFVVGLSFYDTGRQRPYWWSGDDWRDAARKKR